MKKIYSINNIWSAKDIDYLKQFGITIEEQGSKWIDISDPLVYSSICKHYSDKNSYPYYSDFISFEYSMEDLFSSEYCCLSSIRGIGYPQPEGTHHAWSSIVYDENHHCDACGQDHSQTGDFHISKIAKKPFWSFSSWVLDAIFVTADIYKDVFKPLGIGCRHVRKASGKIYEGVLQLVLPTINEDLDLSMHEYSICDTCGRKKYIAQQHYPFFPLHEHPLPNIYLTKEYFGYGGMANRRIIISRELAKKLIKMKLIQPYTLIPCIPNLAEYLKNNGWQIK